MKRGEERGREEKKSARREERKEKSPPPPVTHARVPESKGERRRRERDRGNRGEKEEKRERERWREREWRMTCTQRGSQMRDGITKPSTSELNDVYPKHHTHSLSLSLSISLSLSLSLLTGKIGRATVEMKEYKNPLRMRLTRAHIVWERKNEQKKIPQKFYHRLMFFLSLHEEVGAGGLVGGLEAASRRPDLAIDQRELDLGVMELLGVIAFAELRRNGRRLNDLDAWWSHSMTRCHLIIHLLNCPIQCSIPVLLVHVMIPSSTLVP